MYKIKQVPKDFFVREIPIYSLDEEGDYSYFTLHKENISTIDAVSILAKKLSIPLKRIGYAGNKDKVAITEQIISIKDVEANAIGKVNLPFRLEFIGKGVNPISLGDLEGNYFRIVVRNLSMSRIKMSYLERIPNYFGTQRFSEKNIEIGKAILMRNFGKAVELIDQREVKEYLELHTGDFIGAIRVLPLKLRKMYIHAYQSWVWNLTVEVYLKRKLLKNEKIPIVGFGTELGKDKISVIIKKILKKEGVGLRDFVIKQFPELSSEGSSRDLFMNVKDFKIISIQEDDLNKGKFKAMVSFSLNPGSYATVLIDNLFKNY